MDFDNFSDLQFETMLDIIVADLSPDEIFKPMVLYRFNQPAYGYQKGEMYIYASFLNSFIALDPHGLRSDWVEKGYILPYVDRNHNGKHGTNKLTRMVRQKSIEEVNLLNCYRLNKQAYKDYFGIH